MTHNAKLFVTVLLLLGVCVLVASFADWHPADLRKFGAIFALAASASVLRVTLPKMAGDISFSLMFVMIGVVSLPLAETLVIGCTTLLIESVWRAGTRLTPFQVFFALANMSLAIACSKLAFQAQYFARQHVELPFRILIAATTCFFVNTFSVAAATSLSERISLLKVWQDRAVARYPQYLLAGLVAWAYSLVTFRVGWPVGILILPTLYLLQRTYSLYVGRLEDGKLHAEQMASLHMRTIEALAGAIEAKDDTTHDHLKRVQVYAVELGREFGLSEVELEALRAAAVLHDIGKLAVPEHIISKPGRLTPEEFEKMKVHPVVGAEILERVQFPYPVSPIVRTHHEKWDGTGYPLGLRGEEIPIGARILSVVDCLDALASDRQYRRALPVKEAMARISRESGQAFDPKIVEVLKRRYVELERKAHTEARTTVTARLSRDLKIENSAAPAAGFAGSKAGDNAPRKSSGHTPLEALASARRELANAFDTVQPDGRPLGLTESLSVFAVRLRRLVSYDAIAIYFLKDGVLVPQYVHGDNYKLFSALRIPLGQGLSGWVAENCKPILNGNPSVEPGYLNDPKMFSTLGSALAVPLEAVDSVLGVLTIYRDCRDAFTADDLSLVQATAPRLSFELEGACSDGNSDWDHELDSATGFPGPRILLKQLEAEMARVKRLNTPMAIFVCKIEGLESVKAAYGYTETNKILRTMAAALKDACHGFDFLGRSGPAEFILLSPGMTQKTADGRIARLNHVSGNHGSTVTSVFVGAAFFPEDGTEAEELLAVADRRLAANMRSRASRIEAQAVAVR
jgi:diguanylate cyclase (GGDEF)-like protein/putative nucleotidyltransferase with HDIG domain